MDAHQSENVVAEQDPQIFRFIDTQTQASAVTSVTSPGDFIAKDLHVRDGCHLGGGAHRRVFLHIREQ
jgi:hypothetical protein